MFDGGRPVFVDIDPVTWQIDAGRVEAAITPRHEGAVCRWMSSAPRRISTRSGRLAAATQPACPRRLVRGPRRHLQGPAVRHARRGRLLRAFTPTSRSRPAKAVWSSRTDDHIAFLCRSLRNQGPRSGGAAGWRHPRLGFNYRMCDVVAAIGVEQMRPAGTRSSRSRDRVANWYIRAPARRAARRAAKSAAGLHDQLVRLWSSAWPTSTSKRNRDRLLGQLRAKGIGCQVYFPPIHLQEFYQRDLGCRPGQFPITEALAGADDRTAVLQQSSRKVMWSCGEDAAGTALI